jgi:hypothetical protein
MASNVTLREYSDLGVTYGKVIQAPAEPGIADQQITSGVGSTQSASFNANARIVAIATSATQAIAVKFGANPTASATTSQRLPPNSLTFFGVIPGHKVAVIETA